MYKFIFTKELGRLTKWLRILGFDTEYYNSDNIGTLIVSALRDKRIIVTRRKKIDSLKTVVIESDEIRGQIRELINKLNLTIDESLMFSRCTICNELIEEVFKEEIRSKVPPYVYETQKNFYQCRKCKKVYWQGTHWGNVQRYLKEITTLKTKG